MHVIFSLKLGDHEGVVLFVHGWLLKRTLLIVLPAIQIQIPTRAFLSSSCLLPRPVWDFLVLTDSCWWDTSTLAPNSGKLSIGFVYFILFFLLLILFVFLVFIVKHIFSL